MSLPSDDQPTLDPRAAGAAPEPATISSQAVPARRRRMWPILLGCAGVLLVGCFAVGIGGYFFARDWLRQNFPALLPGAEQPAVAYILDTSTRMSQTSEGETRLRVAQGILAEIVRPADPSLTSGLRVFGGGAVPQACEDTELVVSYAPANQSAIAQGLLGLQVGGSVESALAQSMVAAMRDLQSARGPHSIVVVTGGADSCNPQAGELLAREAEAAGIELRTYVVGFQVPPEEAEALKTMAEAAPGGSYYSAPDAAALRTALQAIQAQIEQPSLTAALREAVQTSAAPDEAERDGEPGRPADGYVPQTACDHPYFPLRQGASWSYSSSDGYGYSWTVSSVSGDLSSAAAVVVMDFTGGSLTFEWTCDAQGVLFYQFGDFAFDQLGTVANFEVTSSSGAPLLPPEAFLPGASWTSAYTMTYSIEASGFSTTFTNTVQESHTAGAPQALSNDLGTFEAIPVTTSSTSSSTSDFGSFDSSWTSTCLYGYGVGLLTCQTSGEGYSSTSQLVSYTLP